MIGKEGWASIASVASNVGRFKYTSSTRLTVMQAQEVVSETSSPLEESIMTILPCRTLLDTIQASCEVVLKQYTSSKSAMTTSTTSTHLTPTKIEKEILESMILSKAKVILILGQGNNLTSAVWPSRFLPIDTWDIIRYIYIYIVHFFDYKFCIL